MSSTQAAKNTTVNDAEIIHFSRDSHQWWDEDGPFAPLHRLNPVRIGYIRDQIEAHFSCSDLHDKSILDVGCGGGLVCEPLSRLGAQITGADADTQAIDVAKAHSQQGGLDITYLNQPVEDIDAQYDVVLALEIIEHVENPQAFVQECAARVKPGGLLIMSTLNRTVKSFLGGIVAAEYILRWVPQGTHDWKKFIKPSELTRMMRAADLDASDLTGLHYDPISAQFTLRRNTIDVNYLLSASKPLR